MVGDSASSRLYLMTTWSPTDALLASGWWTPFRSCGCVASRMLADERHQPAAARADPLRPQVVGARRRLHCTKAMFPCSEAASGRLASGAAEFWRRFGGLP